MGSHLFVVKIALMFETTENKQKEATIGPFKEDFWLVLSKIFNQSVLCKKSANFYSTAEHLYTEETQ